MGRSKEMAIEMAEKEAKQTSLEEAAEMLRDELGARELNPYELLHEIDVTPNLLQKQGLSYLPWPVVYEALNQVFGPDAWDCEELKDERTGNNYFTDGRSAWVEVRIRIHGVWKTCSLPVMDNHNRSIMDGKWTSFDVNDALQRCKVKCAAYWGLGTDVFCKLAKIEIMKQGEAEERRIAEYSARLTKAIADLQQCTSLDILNVIMNNYRDLWNDEAFIAEGKNIKAKLTNA